MKRKLVTLVTAVGIVGGFGTLGTINYEPPANAATNSTHTARPHAAPKPQPRWAEDSLPPELYLWADCNSGPCNLHRARGKIDGHSNCWIAVPRQEEAPALVMCPDGTVLYS